jgi:homoserine kinase
MSNKLNQATAFAPATVANVAVGFDILGFALDVAGDEVTVTRLAEREVRITSIEAPDGLKLPTDPRKNTATGGLFSMIERLSLDHGFEVSIRKGIALGSGMGGSAASAVAAGVAANALLDEPLSKEALLPFLLDGESIASGSRHADNIAPCLLGGRVLIRCLEPLDLISIPVPAGLHCVLAHPHAEVETRAARAILAPSVELKTMVAQSANLAAFMAACFTGDLELMGRSLEDRIIEPQRAHLIPSFREAKRAAIHAGALGLSISGSGPSVFALARDAESAEQIRRALAQVYAEARMEVDLWAAPISQPGARVVKSSQGVAR